VVLDAHDQTPIGGARIQLVFEGSAVTTNTESDGSFRLSPPLPSVAGRLDVSAPWHARLERTLPPPGRLNVLLVTRRRALLTRLIEYGAAFRARVAGAEPTPAELVRQAADLARGDVAVWARAVESAAYGPEPVDAEREAAVQALEPNRAPPADGPS
jgi:hypothetical protein